ncbi:MAG: hypothetical protein M1834_005615 [Cirrosporium novae-zelandiae]|nr:MAG: hypothetical protein M1834_005615 [Cirrosporium novae-zelandiae]
MCGLNAFLSYGQPDGSSFEANSTGPNDVEEAVDAGLDIIEHRGPDARGKWISADHRVGLGHVRLSIVDLSPDGNQPFHDNDNGIHAVVNGELYEYEKHRAELEKDYTFQGNSDCEIVIALYKKYSISFVSRLRGEFAFVIWDEKRQLFFAARDRYGIKPLYYTRINNQILVASEMKCFLPFGWKPEWCLQSLKETSWMFHSGTIFKEVYKVMPGHYLLSKGFGAMEEKPYWDLDYPDKVGTLTEVTQVEFKLTNSKREVETRSEEEMILGVRERLLDAVRLRMRADVPLGIYLSGGIDSSAIAGMVTHLIKQGVEAGSDKSGDISHIKCFNIQFEKDSGVDESDVARRTAEFLGLDFCTVYMDEETIASRIEAAVWHSETLCPGSNGPGRLAVSELARSKGLRVILTGEGSDEHFAGYDYFLPERLREPDPAWPYLPFSDDDLRKALSVKDEKSLFGQAASTEPHTVNRMLNNSAIASGLSRYTPAPFAPWTNSLLTSTTDIAFAEGLDGMVREKIANKWHPLHTAEYTWAKSILPNVILRYLADGLDMVYQVESRPPFLDHYFTEYANNLPPSLKIKYVPETGRFHEKYILREAVKPFITEEVYRRKKQPFKGPAKYARNGPIHNLLIRLITEENVNQLGFIDWLDVQTIMHKAFQEYDGPSVRQAMSVAQFIILAQRFGVEKPFCMRN